MNKVLFISVFILISITCLGQRETDTVRVVILACDTAHKSEFDYLILSHKEAGCDASEDTTRTVHIRKIEKDIPVNSGDAKWVFGYSIREKHNTDEGRIDPYFEYGYVSRDYWVHVKYLTMDKKPFPNTVIIWQSVDAKK